MSSVQLAATRMPAIHPRGMPSPMFASRVAAPLDSTGASA
jgi:hypothetical protein